MNRRIIRWGGDYMDKNKLRYAILKEISEGNTPLTEQDFGVNEEQFDEAVGFLTREKYAEGICRADDRPVLEKIGPIATEKGERYLAENSTLAKAYKGLKEIKSWIK